MQARRRFYFDNYFKRVLHRPTGDPLRPTDDDRRRGFVVFQRDFMQDVFHNDTPFAAERGDVLRGEAFAGEYEPVTLGLVPLRDLGKVAVERLRPDGAGRDDPVARDRRGFRLESHQPRHHGRDRLHDQPAADHARRDRGRARGPDATVLADDPDAGRCPARRLQGDGHDPSGEGRRRPQVPLEFRVRAGTLDPVDIPAGPFGYRSASPGTTTIPGPRTSTRQMAEKSLRKLREYGFTAFSGLPSIAYQGFKDGKPVLDFRAADAQMKQVKDMGFLAVVTYGGGRLRPRRLLTRTPARWPPPASRTTPRSSGPSTPRSRDHADRNGWIPVYFNIGDEPIGDDVVRSAENAEAYRKAFPKGPPFFTAASSFTGSDRQNPHFRLSKALHVVDWNVHDEASVNLLHQAGGDWAFYNGGNRWTYGIYMYKAAKQYGMKFRLAWHWNVVAGDPYYALDCREDDYAWCNASPDGRLIPSVEFERLREGLDDYRRLLTLSRLAAENPGNPAARAARELIDRRDWPRSTSASATTMRCSPPKTGPSSAARWMMRSRPCGSRTSGAELHPAHGSLLSAGRWLQHAGEEKRPQMNADQKGCEEGMRVHRAQGPDFALPVPVARRSVHEFRRVLSVFRSA